MKLFIFHNLFANVSCGCMLVQLRVDFRNSVCSASIVSIAAYSYPSATSSKKHRPAETTTAPTSVNVNSMVNIFSPHFSVCTRTGQEAVCEEFHNCVETLMSV